MLLAQIGQTLEKRIMSQRRTRAWAWFIRKAYSERPPEECVLYIRLHMR